ncbi:MAG: phenylalanine--tRNA ligase subunit alpha, partial [Bacteroidales bacterium]|nr:phenylalanine--tRNA ligase subunit alpha [Bacteroidales bacterium]
MIEKIKEFIEEVEKFQADTKEKAEELRLKFLSKKGILNDIFAEFKKVEPAQKKEYGQKINSLKQAVEAKL